jgi:hypothetical protein
MHRFHSAGRQRALLAHANEREVGDRPGCRATGSESVVGNFLPREAKVRHPLHRWTRRSGEYLQCATLPYRALHEQAPRDQMDRDARLRVSVERRHANSPSTDAPNSHMESGSGTAARTPLNWKSLTQ